MKGPDLEVRPGLVIPATELEEQTSRSGGPGGQHVNTTDTRVTLRWNVVTSAVLDDRTRARLLEALGPRLTNDGVLVLHASSTRSQAMNREDVRERLVALVQEALRPRKARRPTRPTKSSVKRRLEGKKRRSDTKRQRQGRPGDE